MVYIKEEWRPVLGYEGLYEISSHGHVKALPKKVYVKGNYRNCPEKNLKISKDNAGYSKVTLTCLNNSRTIRVHVLVAEAFIGKRPEGLVVCHGVNGRDDNSVGNLRYDSVEENNKDRFRQRITDEKKKFRKLCSKDVKEIYRLLEQGYSYQEIAKKYDTSDNYIGKIARGERWDWLRNQGEL